MKNTNYILEYRYDEDTEWTNQAEFDYVSDAQHALTEHVAMFNYIKVRVRQVKIVTEESIVGEYNPVTVEDV